jgi:Peptidase A4 family
MARRWYVPLIALPAAIGIAVAVLEGVASASPGLTRSAAPAVQRELPGGPMVSLSGGAGVRNGTVNPVSASLNWAGYAVESNTSGAFRSVSASWREPRVNCSGVRGRRLASFWVGLDGANSNSVEQLGTDSDCRGKTPSYFAWWEMFPAVSVDFHTSVRPGDLMTASVTFRGTKTYVLFIRDATRHWKRTIIKNEAGLARSSAEIIAEAPALLINGQAVIQNLADFANLRFTGSRVNGTPLKKIGRRIRITMVEVKAPHRIRATTSPVGSADVFTCHWVRAA